MRAIVLLANLLVLGLAYYFGSFMWLLAALGVTMLLAVGFFALSMARTDAYESKDMKRAMGRNTTLLGRLF
jgi:hypothetical protein